MRRKVAVITLGRWRITHCHRFAGQFLAVPGRVLHEGAVTGAPHPTAVGEEGIGTHRRLRTHRERSNGAAELGQTQTEWLDMQVTEAGSAIGA